LKNIGKRRGRPLHSGAARRVIGKEKKRKKERTCNEESRRDGIAFIYLEGIPVPRLFKGVTFTITIRRKGKKDAHARVIKEENSAFREKMFGLSESDFK